MMCFKTDGSSRSQVRIFAVVVLYGSGPSQSSTIQTLLVAAEQALRDDILLGILVWDNTPQSHHPAEIPASIRYEASARNSGLAAAYNRALNIASAEKYEWLLTLDQDSALPPDFLLRLGKIVRNIEATPSIAAIVPWMVGQNRNLSPYRYTRTGTARWFAKGVNGVSSHAIFAFNSASTTRVSALRQIGGYHPWFWLDGSDHYMFRQLHRYGKSVYIAGDIEVEHRFSMQGRKLSVSAKRYRNILLSESAFLDSERSSLGGIDHTARLAIRVLQHWRDRDSRELRVLTHEFLWRRLFWSRSRRMRAWALELKELFPELPGERFQPFDDAASLDRPRKLSVCMAAYNGGPYVREQLRSILSQLREQDELIIVDDASTDETLGVIKACNDPRIHLIEHPINRGVVATFEEALRNATGDIIFLADDDDIWAPNKVEKVVEAFRAHPEAKIVSSRVSLIDENGAASKDTLYDNRKTFHSGFWRNLWINRFQGSAMAFRASLLHSVLPFPRDVDFLHDHWIGSRNAACGGKVVYIDEPLLLYRRHSRNVSRRLPLVRQVKSRLQSIWANFYRRWLGRPV